MPLSTSHWVMTTYPEMGHWRSMTALCTSILIESPHRQISLFAHPVVAQEVYADVEDRLCRRRGKSYCKRKLEQLRLVCCPQTSDLGALAHSYDRCSQLGLEMQNAFPAAWKDLFLAEKGVRLPKSEALAPIVPSDSPDCLLEPTLLMTDMLGLGMSSFVRTWMLENRPSENEFPILMWWSTFVCRLFQHVCEVDMIGAAPWTHRILASVAASGHDPESATADDALQKAYANAPEDGLRLIKVPGIVEPMYEHEYNPTNLIPPPMLMRTVSGARTQALDTCTAVVCATSSALEHWPIQAVRDILAARGKQVYGIGLLMPTLKLSEEKHRKDGLQCKHADHTLPMKVNPVGRCSETCTEAKAQLDGSEWDHHCSYCAKDVPYSQALGQHQFADPVKASKLSNAKIGCESHSPHLTALEFMDHALSQHGHHTVMLFSFGSVVFPSLPGVAETMLDTLLDSWNAKDAADRIPFVFATGAPMFTNSPGLMERLKVARSRGQCFFDGWIPQQDVLQHPAMGTFVMHCGYNSTVESIAAAVPIIAVPLTGDQPVAAAYQSETLNIAWELLSCKSKSSYRARKKPESISQELTRIFQNESRPRDQAYQRKKKAILELRKDMLEDLESGVGRANLTKMLQLG